MTMTNPDALQRIPPQFRTVDPEEISRHMSSAFRPNRSTVSGGERADFSHRSLHLGGASIHQVRYGRAAQVDAPPFEPVVLAMFTLSGCATIDQGDGRFEAPAGSFCILNAARHLKIGLSADFEQLTVRLDSATLARALLESGDCDLRGDLAFAPCAYDLQRHPSGFARFVDCICGELSRDASRCTTPAVAPHLERTLAGLLVTEFRHNYSHLLEADRRSPAPAVVRRAEEYMRERLGEALGMPELARAAGCSPRSLQQAFRQFRHTTPSAWLRLRRLERARELLLASGSDASVTAIAYACGFTHLSKFAAHYRLRFGESPQQTWRQARTGAAARITTPRS